MTLELAYSEAWYDSSGLVDDGPPWVGRAALAVGALAVTAGALTVAGTVAGVVALHRLLHRRAS